MKLFKEYQLNLDTKCDLKLVDYLDNIIRLEKRYLKTF